MGVKLSQLEQPHVRATVSIEGVGLVTIVNPKGKVRIELMDFIKKKMGNKGITINQNEVITLFMNKLTDLEIDVEDVSSMLDNGSLELNKIMFYLTTIVQELTYEILCQQNLELQMLEKTLLADDTLVLTKNIETLIEKRKERKRLTSKDGETKKNTKKK